MKHPRILPRACALLLAATAAWAAEKAPAAWRAWLDDVRPIMTRAERQAFALLATEEDRLRFQAAFWKVRDPDPASPVNECQEEYSRRLADTREKFGGPRSDRGRLYLLLGKPRAVSRFSGEQELVECELWSYSGLSDRGLPPFLNFLFYKPRDIGDFRQFYPGMQNAADLVLPGAGRDLSTPQAAYRLVHSVSGELADAALSLVPGEGDPHDPVAASTSALVMARVQELPEKEVSSSYLRNFSAAGGSVQVSDSSRRIMGWGDIGVSGGGDSWFIHYAMLPDRVALRRKGEQSHVADIVVYLTIEDGAGRGVYAAETPTHLDVTDERRLEMDDKKVLFRGFCPVVPGRYRVRATLINKGNGDFFSVQRDVAVGPAAPALLGGFQLVPARGRFLPFAAGDWAVLSDPRFLYSRSDTLCGLVSGAAAPDVRLLDKDGREAAPLAVQAAGAGSFRFAGSLKAVADGTYALVLRQDGQEAARRTVFVMPDYIPVKRPFALERSDAGAALASYQAVRAEQLLNLGRPLEALALLESVPASARTPAARSLLAQACYNTRNYARVLELLAGPETGRTYAELTLLANSAIEMKRYDQAVGCLEQLRRYGDSAEVNHLLAAAWTLLGDAGKARAYHERALALAQNNPE